MKRIVEIMDGMDLVISVKTSDGIQFVNFDFDELTFTNLKDATVFTTPLDSVQALFIANSIIEGEYEIVEVINQKSSYRDISGYTEIIDILIKNSTKIKEEINKDLSNILLNDKLKFRISLNIRNSSYFIKELPNANLIDIETVEDIIPYITKSFKNAAILTPMDLQQKPKHREKKKVIHEEMLEIIKSAYLIFDIDIKNYLEILFNYMVKQEILEQVKDYNIIK